MSAPHHDEKKSRGVCDLQPRTVGRRRKAGLTSMESVEAVLGKPLAQLLAGEFTTAGRVEERMFGCEADFVALRASTKRRDSQLCIALLGPTFKSTLRRAWSNKRPGDASDGFCRGDGEPNSRSGRAWSARMTACSTMPAHPAALASAAVPSPWLRVRVQSRRKRMIQHTHKRSEDARVSARAGGTLRSPLFSPGSGDRGRLAK